MIRRLVQTPAPTFFALLLTTFIVQITALHAADWPQWRGTERNGKSPETGLLGSWPADGPPLAWTASGLGAGYSSVAVSDGRVFSLGDIAGGQHALAIDQTSGEVIWKTRIGEVWDDRFPGPRSTPTIDGNRAYVLSTAGDLFCLESATGKVIWKTNLQTDLGGDLMKAMDTTDWRYSESPLIDEGRVIVTPGAADAALAAFDKTDGKLLWKTTVPELGEAGRKGAGYSSVVVSEAAGVRQYVQLIGRGVVGVEAATGKFLWGYNRVANDVANIATPIVWGNYVFASTGYNTGSALLEIEKTANGLAAKEVYFLEADTMQNHHGGVILHDGHVYTGTGHNKGFPLAVEVKTGKVSWGPIRNDGQSSAAIAYADGNLYFRYQDGLMVLIEANPSEYKEKGTFRIPDVKRESWPHPVISDGKLYLREQDMLYCYDIRDGGASAASASP